MKKAIALLVAVAAVMSFNVSAMAVFEWGSNTTEANPTLNVSDNQLILGFSSGGNVAVLPETFLQPGHEYSYQIFRVDGQHINAAPNTIAMTPVTDAMLDGAKLRIRTVKGSANVVSSKIEKKGTGSSATYHLVVETRETFGTKVHDLEYTIMVTGQPANAPNKLLDANILLQTGYRAMLDSDIESYGEGDTVTIMDDRPVITRKQFETLAKNYNYRAVEFIGEGHEWNYTGRVSGMGDSNFITSHDVITEILDVYPEQDYKFITFNAGVTFPTNGEMRIDVSDMEKTGTGTNNHGLHAYLYRDGALTPINTTYDATADEIVFRTNYLGSFVVTDREITEFGYGPEIQEPEFPEPAPEHLNPPTGAASSAAMVIGLAALASGGIISGKRRK